jgi:hypothetical protein
VAASASIGLFGGEKGRLELRDRRYILRLLPRFLAGRFLSLAAATPRITCLAFLVLVLSMTWFDLLPGGLVLAVIFGITAIIVWQTRKETGVRTVSGPAHHPPLEVPDHCGFASQGLQGLDRPN